MPTRRPCFRHSAAAGGTARIWSRIFMKNKSSCGTPASMAPAVAALLVCLGGCSHKAEEPRTAASAVANVTLTAAQRQNIRVYTVQPTQYRKTIEVNGVVDFDNDQATSVLAPFSGPVSRLLVSAGDPVKQGAPLAAVASPDFAAAVSAYQKALATAQTNRRLAALHKDL